MILLIDIHITGPQISTKLLESSFDAVFKTQSQNKKSKCYIDVRGWHFL